MLALDANALGQDSVDLTQGPPLVLPELPAADAPKRHRPVPERDADGLRDRTPIVPPGAPLSPHAPPARARAGRH